jgi:predicted transcriptional regulator
VGGIALPIPTPEDLVVMKAIAHRARDLGDIEGIVAMHPRLDTVRIRRLVREFAEVLEAPEIVADLDRALGRARHRRGGRSKPG